MNLDTGIGAAIQDAKARIVAAARDWYTSTGNREAALAAAVQDLILLERSADVLVADLNDPT